MSTKTEPDRLNIDVANLDFDPNNPRFSPEVASGPEGDLIERFIRDERLLEVLNSIADQGYFSGEPLLVVPVAGTNRYHVIEGNRRLAALKLLRGLSAIPLGRSSIEEACENAKHRPPKVPCLIFADEDAILRYLGFRHITGIKSWSSLQKARYIKKLRDRFYANLDGKAQVVALAREIGSRADYVAQMLTALNLYERAEAKNFYDDPGLNPQEVEFSLLSTAISYNNIVTYLGLESRQDMTGKRINDESLKNVMSWLFVARGNQKTVLGDSRNLKRLAAVVDSPAAIKQLLADGNLESAFQLSRGPAQALSLALKAIEAKLQEAWSWMPMVDMPETGDEDIADTIRKRAVELREAIKAKRSADDE
jgi:hypothetical protein